MAFLPPGRQFEELVALIEKSVYHLQNVKVEHNVKMRTSYGKERQIDILISDERDKRYTYKTIIECKNKGGRFDLNTVGAFKELMDSVNAHQGIIVSAAGFQSGAIESAKERNILLYELSKPKEIESHFLDKKFGYHELRHQSKEIIVSFREMKTINQEVTFYSVLYAPSLDQKIKLVDVAQHFLDQNYQSIFDTLIKKATNLLSAQSHTANIQVAINFPNPPIFTFGNEQTEIIDFTAEIDTELFLALQISLNRTAFRTLIGFLPSATLRW